MEVCHSCLRVSSYPFSLVKQLEVATEHPTVLDRAVGVAGVPGAGQGEISGLRFTAGPRRS